MALGIIGKGFSDWVAGSRPDKTCVPIASEVGRVTEAILVALKRLSGFAVVGESARFSCARIVGVLGSSILPSLPQVDCGTVSQESTREQICMA
jgi:exportin-T